MSITEQQAPATQQTYDVVIVGAGFSGVYQLWKLRERGFNVVLLEASDDFGGTWNNNRYPGARVDSDAPIYQFSDPELWKDWNYDERFPDHHQLRKYFKYVDSKLDLRKDAQFNTKILEADWDEPSRTWSLKTDTGQVFKCHYAVFATGSTFQPYVPDFAGMDDFGGSIAHAGRWDEDLDYANKRVAVIGTGASGVQIIQEMGTTASHLTVFQRTPNLSLPMQQEKWDEKVNADQKQNYAEWFEIWGDTFGGFHYDFDPRSAKDVTEDERLEFYEQRWQAGGFQFWLGGFSDYLFDMESNRLAYDFWRDKIRAKIKDPVKRDLLAPMEPPHPFGTKRPCLHQNYYDVLNQDNVDIVAVGENPIETFTPKGIRTADGVEHEFDIVVLATGYDTNTGALTKIDVRGTDGSTLRDKWVDGVDVYLGSATNGYPNMLFLYGPQSPAAFMNGPASAELQGDRVIKLLEHLRDRGDVARIESTKEADRGWTAQIKEIDDMALFKHAKSWYNASNIPGKHSQMLQFPGGVPAYFNGWDTEEESGYTKGFVIN